MFALTRKMRFELWFNFDKISHEISHIQSWSTHLKHVLTEKKSPLAISIIEEKPKHLTQNET